MNSRKAAECPKVSLIRAVVQHSHMPIDWLVHSFCNMNMSDTIFQDASEDTQVKIQPSGLR